MLVDRALARTLPRMQQHVLDDRVGAFAVLNDLVEIALGHRDEFDRFVAHVLRERSFANELAKFVEQLARQRRKVVDEIERVLDLVGDAGGELPERGEFFRLHQSVLRLAQVVERLLELARSRTAPRRTVARSRSRSPPDRRKSAGFRPGAIHRAPALRA